MSRELLLYLSSHLFAGFAVLFAVRGRRGAVALIAAALCVLFYLADID